MVLFDLYRTTAGGRHVDSKLRKESSARLPFSPQPLHTKQSAAALARVRSACGELSEAALGAAYRESGGTSISSGMAREDSISYGTLSSLTPETFGIVPNVGLCLRGRLTAQRLPHHTSLSQDDVRFQAGARTRFQQPTVREQLDRRFFDLQNDERGGEGGEPSDKSSHDLLSNSRPDECGVRHGSTSPNCSRRSCGSWGRPHDERHKGKSDAFDILGKLDAAGALFSAEIDYKRLELDRCLDTTSFAADLRDDADRLASAVLGMGDVPETIVNVRSAWFATR